MDSSRTANDFPSSLGTSGAVGALGPGIPPLSGFPNSQHNFEPAVMQFKLCFPCDHTIITVPESPMFNAPEADVVTKPRLELVRKAGEQYARAGEIEESLLADIGSPHDPGRAVCIDCEWWRALQWGWISSRFLQWRIMAARQSRLI